MSGKNALLHTDLNLVGNDKFFKVQTRYQKIPKASITLGCKSAVTCN